jgi:hypothetical protein
VRRRGASIRHHRQYDQRERGVGDRVEQVERLKRSQVLCRRDDEARDRLAATEAEVGRDAPERERGSTCSGVTRVMNSVWFAVRAAPTPAPPTTAQANACHGRSANAKPA